MTLRTRLLLLFLPAMIACTAALSFFVYSSWYTEIVSTFGLRLKATVSSCASMIKGDELEKLLDEPPHKIIRDPIYQNTRIALTEVLKRSGLTHIYVVKLERVNVGEPPLKDTPVSSINKTFDGKNSKLAYRQVFLIDISQNVEDILPPGSYDFSESNEIRVYETKEPIISKIYEPKGPWGRMMSGFAPILNSNNEVIALLGADISSAPIDKKIHETLIMIVAGALVTLFIVAGIVFAVAYRISKPVAQLKNAALSIAAGNYGEKIAVEGPKEIVELANGFNTMSECLQENISHIQANSLLKERLFGEYECARLLQYHMLQKPLEPLSANAITKCVSLLSPQPTGLWLKQEIKGDDCFLHLLEAKNRGFEGAFQLLAQEKESTAMEIKIDIKLIEENYSITSTSQAAFAPLLWQNHEEAFIKLSSGKTFEAQTGDILFFYNQGLMRLMSHPQRIFDWIHKVARHFALDGIDTCATILSKDLNFQARRRHIDQDVHLIILQLK